jgi:hypothetical protein
VCRVGEMCKKRIIYMRHIKLKNIAMHGRPEMVQLRSLTVSNMSGYPANPCARVILLVVTRLRERSGPKKN